MLYYRDFSMALLSIVGLALPRAGQGLAKNEPPKDQERSRFQAVNAMAPLSRK